MENFYNENEGKLKSGAKPGDEEKSEDNEMPHIKRNPEHRKRQVEERADQEGQSEEGKQEIQGNSKDEGNPLSEDEPDLQGKPGSEPWAAEKRSAEDHVPRKAKRKSDKGAEDSSRDCQENLEEKHLGEEMKECGDLSRPQEELRKKQKVSGFHWTQRDVHDHLAPRGQRGIRGVRGGGRGQRGLHDIPYL
ncbi:transcription elongation factor A protein-like 3 [Suncus etruscus]|uniref:transcription elongation factor A protein-like 3 n=1 Tax=Suncus etruscus TaxID=109475 RepID=UPI00210F2C02|nr:transcription elongation factor A protein-like 3 [Suncus etruscus]XP_049622594.1 transcription elongation factor A protein-like 3 [Suncus etruscus]